MQQQILKSKVDVLNTKHTVQYLHISLYITLVILTYMHYIHTVHDVMRLRLNI